MARSDDFSEYSYSFPGFGRTFEENVNVPGFTSRVDAENYLGMKKVLPKSEPGLTQVEMMAAVKEQVARGVSGGLLVHWTGETPVSHSRPMRIEYRMSNKKS